MTRTVSRALRVLMGAVAILAAGPVLAQPMPRPAQVMPSATPADVQVGVTVIRASNDGVRVDARLSSWSQHLTKLPFRAFDQVTQQRYRLHDGGRQELRLPDGHTVTLTLASHGADDAKVGVSSHRAGAEPVETVLTIKRDRSFMYVLRTGRPDTAFLLRIDVQY